MPMYSSVCLKCGDTHSYVRTVTNRADTPVCCETATTKMLDIPMVSAMTWTDHKGFYVGDKWIATAQDYKKHMADNGVVPASEGEQEVAIQSKQKAVDNDRKLSAAVLEAYRRHNPI